MNKLTRVMAASTASAAMMGLALIGSAGAASADSRSDREMRTVSTSVVDRDGVRHDQDDRPYRHHDQDDRTPRHNEDDGSWYWHSRDGRDYRYDGRHFALWIHGKWVTVTQPDRPYGFDHWYFNQLWDSKHHNVHQG
jgi:hypothetical protein